MSLNNSVILSFVTIWDEGEAANFYLGWNILFYSAW